MALTTREEEAMNHIMDGCNLMEWDMAVGNDEEVSGLVIGTKEYLEKMIPPKDDKLYHAIEMAIIAWNIDGHKTAGTLTREIMGIIKPKK